MRRLDNSQRKVVARYARLNLFSGGVTLALALMTALLGAFQGYPQARIGPFVATLADFSLLFIVGTLAFWIGALYLWLLQRMSR